jgi:DNA-binding PadR family transcriptional regulator
VHLSLEYAILGFLNYQPFTGYDLKKLFDTSVRHFWTADQSQIYRTLARLTEQGLAEVERVEQQDRPDRKIYHITPAGRDAFVRWLGGPFPNEASRSGPLVQVFFAAQLSDEEVLAKFKIAREIFRTVLDRYEQVPDQVKEYEIQIPSPREHYFWMLTLDLGVRTMRAQLEWAEQVIADLENRRVPGE